MVPASCPQPDSPTADACIALFTYTSARDLVEAATARVFTLLLINISRPGVCCATFGTCD
jgi:hypothetical protein